MTQDNVFDIILNEINTANKEDHKGMDIVVYYDDGKVHNIEDILCINNDQNNFYVLLKDDTVLHLVREDIASIKIYGGKYD